MQSTVSKITVTIPNPLRQTLDEVVQGLNTTRSQVVREAIEQYLKDQKKQAIEEALRQGYLAMTEDDRDFHQQIAEEGMVTANEALRAALGDDEEKPWW